MIGTREQAEVYMTQGSLCRAAVIMEHIVKAEPTNVANLELLADIYMRQGLHEDAMLLMAKGISVSITTLAPTSPLVN